MDNDYLLVVTGPTIFREERIPASKESVLVGTDVNCDVRYRAEQFKVLPKLELVKNRDAWLVSSLTPEVCLCVDGAAWATSLRAGHGSTIEVRVAATGGLLFNLSLSIDFGFEDGSYDRIVDLSAVSELRIGGRDDCNLYLNSSFTAGDLVVISRGNNGLVLEDKGTRYGVKVNGTRIQAPMLLRDKTFFSIANFLFYYDALQLRCAKKANISFRGIGYGDETPRCVTSAYPLFIRNARIKSVMDDEKIPILDPPSAPHAPGGNIAMQLIPAILMVGMSFGMRYFMGNSSNTAYILMSVAMMSMGVFTSAFGIISERKNYKKAKANRIKKYTKYIEQKRQDVEAFRKEELSVLDRTYPSLANEMRMVQDFSGDLFDRVSTDGDFLDLRLGTGMRRSVKQVDFRPRERFETDELAELPQQVYDEFYYVKNAPVSINLRESGALGVVGNDEQILLVLKNMVIDVATRHFPTDVKIFFIAEKDDEPIIHWARNLPHVQNEELNRRNIVCDEESRNVLFEYLYKVLSEREGRDEKTVKLPHFVIFVVDECGLKTHPLSQFITEASSLGVTFVFFEGYKEYLPVGCSSIITLSNSSYSGRMVSTENDRNAADFSYETIDDFSAWMVSQTLAPVYSEQVSLEGSLTTSYTLYEMLGILNVEDIDLAKRWNDSIVYRSLAAPIGVSKAGVVNLDLSDRADGPHGLVAGTTGSGKSETLLTYLISLATLFHPHEVAFMVIDFKGGGMANRLRGLPHLVGTITNIDGREIDRSLKSIRAELQKRQRYFAEADVDHIDAYIRKYKARQVDAPLPHLIIVVDEFAELKADQPEFMAELISAARIGRSLGVHLILATQKPAGQVNEQIWSNSRFKLCLKVQSREDSNEVLKSPLAAEIKEAGRAYLQVGNNEKFELFQSAYGGGPERQDDEQVHEFTVFGVENSGKRIPIYAKRREESDELHTTQLDAVIRWTGEYCRNHGIEGLPKICLPSLPDVLNYSPQHRHVGQRICLGTYDDPDSQYQGDALFDLDNANCFIVGAVQMGKTNLLEAIIRGIVESTTPLESAIYIIDFSSMILKNLEDLNHVGGVVISSEDEKLKNLFKLLTTEVASRKARLLEVGVSSFASYLDAGYHDLPHIYVLMDNFAVFQELYAERYEDAFLSLCRESLTYGISLIIANNTTQGFGYRYMSNFSCGIALTCNDSGEYQTLFERNRLQPKNTAGRALCSFDKQVYEFQSYLAFEGEREVERVKTMRDFVWLTNEKNAGLHAKAIPSVPDSLNLAYIHDHYAVSQGKLPLGLSYETVEPIYLDLNTQFRFALVGEREGMRAAFARMLVEELKREHLNGHECQLFIVDSLQRELRFLEQNPLVSSYYGDYNDIDLVMGEVTSIFEERMDRVREDGLSAIEHDSYVVILVNSTEAVKRISTDMELSSNYERMDAQAKGIRIMFVFTAIEDEGVGYADPQILRDLQSERRAISLSNASEQKFFDVPIMVTRAYAAPLEHGEAFYLEGQGFSKVRLAIDFGME